MAQVINTNVGALFAGAALNKSAICPANRPGTPVFRPAHQQRQGRCDRPGHCHRLRFQDSRREHATFATPTTAFPTAQTSDGYLAQITENTQRLREIFVQTGAVTNQEAVALLAENARIDGLVLASTAVTVDEGGGTAGGTGTTFTAATAGALTSLANFDTELGDITTARAKFGADMASLASAVATLQTASVNLSASYSRIMDTDYAAETAAQAKNNILQQAGTAVLAQANQTPQTVLTLLR